MRTNIRFSDGTWVLWRDGVNTPTCFSTETLTDCLTRLGRLSDFVSSSNLSDAVASDIASISYWILAFSIVAAMGFIYHGFFIWLCSIFRA